MFNKKKKYCILHELLVFYLTKIVYCATLATIQNAWGVGRQDTKCGTSECLGLGKCAFSIKALYFALGHSGGYTPLP